MATFTGTSNADTANATTGTLIGFTGGSLAELQDGIGDIFNGLGGNDTIIAGSGNDVINGGVGVDSLVGGDGDDAFVWDSSVHLGGDSVDGDAGFDRLELLGSAQIYDFSFLGISEVEALLFNTSGAGLRVDAQFTASQFGGAGIANTLAITGDGNQNIIFITDATSFTAGAFTFTNWGPDDLIAIAGSFLAPTNDTITGSSQADFIYGSGGADALNGGDGDDIFSFTMGDVVTGESIDGDAGADALQVQDFGTVNFRLATIS